MQLKISGDEQAQCKERLLEIFDKPGGFRHSDTVLVTDDGAEMLTYYPRDLESLSIPL